MAYNKIEEYVGNNDVSGKKILVRVDFNVPMQNGQISDDTRLRAALPTIELLSKAGVKTILLSHFGRPKGKIEPSMSLEPIAPALAELLGKNVGFAADLKGEIAQSAIDKMQNGDIIILENSRFYAGEEKNDAELAKEVAALGDIYVNDAFSAAHRAHVTLSLIHIYVGNRNINREQVQSGCAWAYRQYLHDPKMIGLEQEARRKKIGLWSQKSFYIMPPWVERRLKN